MISSARNSNNYDLLRVILASIVFMFHLSILTSEMVYPSYIFDGGWAVKCFFVISGLLVTSSYLRSKDFIDYAVNRLVRIVPLYSICIFVCFIFGMQLSKFTAIDYLSSDSLKYLFFNLIFLNFFADSLPGVFENNPFPNVINGSLWTIKIELILYLGVAILCGNSYKNDHKNLLKCFVFALIIFITLHATLPENGTNNILNKINEQLFRMAPYFFIGSIFAVINLQKIIMYFAFLFALVYFIFMPYNYILDILSCAFFVIFLGEVTSIKIKWPRSIGDISYGIYIWHFPIIQTIYYYGLFEKSTIFGAFLATIIVFCLSILSWHFIEIKCIKARKKLKTYLHL